MLKNGTFTGLSPRHGTAVVANISFRTYYSDMYCHASPVENAADVPPTVLICTVRLERLMGAINTTLACGAN